jgi:hypothetical protein
MVITKTRTSDRKSRSVNIFVPVARFREFGTVSRSGGLQAELKLIGGSGRRSPPVKREVSFCT